MYKNRFFYEGIDLGSAISAHDDAFKALEEGRQRAGEIARALRQKIAGVQLGDIEIRLTTYDPQYVLDGGWFPVKKDHMTVGNGRPTLKSLNVSTGPKKKED